MLRVRRERAWSKALAPYIAPGLLLSVFVLQFFLVFRLNLSPWKGGGFGMFSTAESPGSRVVRAYLKNGSQRIPIIIPAEFTALEREIRTFPRTETLHELAQKMAAGTWVPYRLLPPAEHYRVLQEKYAKREQQPRGQNGSLSVDVYSLQNAAYLGLVFERMNLVRMAEKGEETGGSVAFQQVESEVWQVRYSSSERELKLDLLKTAQARRNE